VDTGLTTWIRLKRHMDNVKINTEAYIAKLTVEELARQNHNFHGQTSLTCKSPLKRHLTHMSTRGHDPLWRAFRGAVADGNRGAVHGLLEVWNLKKTCQRKF